jgi:hypothetical protein
MAGLGSLPRRIPRMCQDSWKVQHPHRQGPPASNTPPTP